MNIERRYSISVFFSIISTVNNDLTASHHCRTCSIPSPVHAVEPP